METTRVEYTIAVSGPGLVVSTARTFNRSHVRGFVLARAFSFAREGNEVTVAVLPRRIHKRISECGTPMGARVLSVYRFEGGQWQRVDGNVVSGLDGCDKAAVYQVNYPMAHVTREYAEQMAATL